MQAQPEGGHTVHTCTGAHGPAPVPLYGCFVLRFLLLSLYFKHLAHQELFLCIIGLLMCIESLPEDAP